MAPPNATAVPADQPPAAAPMSRRNASADVEKIAETASDHDVVAGSVP
jgi:hypothetical protein